MSSIDERVVEMKLNNKQFMTGVDQTLKALSDLKKGLQTGAAVNGLSDLSKSADGVASHFSAMSVAAVTAIATIAHAAVSSALAFGKSFSLGPISAGLKEYETNLNSIQTILANTGLEGQKGLNKVNGALEELNDYSDKTIYNFSEMARNIGTFTAAGVSLDKSTAAIKGIANLAALSGSNSQQASTAMYQLSQALAAGKVSLMDWNSVVNAGMGGKVFQNALKETARAHGVAVDSIIKKQGSFRASISEGWITSEIMTETLSKFTGDLSREQLKSMGYTNEQIKGIIKMGKVASDSATKVKTFSQLLGTLKEAAGSGWAKTWSLVIGDFGEAKSLWTGVNDVLGGFIQRSADARNEVLGEWKEMGGRAVLLEGLGNIFKSLGRILGSVRDAFRDIFPAMTGKRLYDMTVAFRDFTEGLKIGDGLLSNFRNTMKGVFAIFGIGWAIIKGVLSVFASLFGLMSGGSGGILAVSGGIGELLDKLHQWLVEGGRIQAFFDMISQGTAYLKPVVDMFGRLVDVAVELTSTGFETVGAKIAEGFEAVSPIIEDVVDAFEKLLGFGAGAASGFAGIFNLGGAGKAVKGEIDSVRGSLETVKKAADTVGDAFAQIGPTLEKIKDSFMRFVHGVGSAIDWVKAKVKELASGIGIEDTLAVVNTGFFMALYFTLQRFLSVWGDVGKGIDRTLKSFTGVLDQTTSTLKTMQTEVRSNIILKIAASLVLLAGALWILSKIDGKALAMSLGAVATLMGMLVGAILLLENKMGDGLKGSARMIALSIAMGAMAVAILAMAGAVAILAQIPMGDLLKGLGALAAILVLVTAMSVALGAMGGGVTMILVASSLIILAAGLTAFAGAMALYAALDTDMMKEGGIKIVAAIAAVGIAMSFMPKGMLVKSAGLFIVANALIALAAAMKIFANFSVEEMAKSMTMLGLSLKILSVALIAMSGTLKGAAALMIAAAALAVMVPMLIMLGQLDVQTIAIGLLAMAGMFAVLAAGLYVLSPLAPVLVALAGGIALLGLAALAVGAGLFLFAAGLAALAASGAAGIAVLAGAVITISQLIPLVMHQIGLGLIALAKVIANAGPPLIAAFTTVLRSFITAVIKNTPLLTNMLITFVLNGLRAIRTIFPAVVATGISMIMSLLTGIKNNIGRIVTTAGDIIVKWMQAMSKQLPRITDAGVKMIIAFVQGLADAVNNNADAMRSAGMDLAKALINGMTGGLFSGVSAVKDAAVSVAKSALDGAKGLLGISSPSKEFYKIGRYVTAGFRDGLIGGEADVKTALDSMRNMLKKSMEETRATIKRETERLERLRKRPNTAKNRKAIRDAERELRAARRMEDNIGDAYKRMNTTMAKQQTQLKSLGRQYDRYVVKLEEANKVLDEAKKLRDDFAKSTTDKFNVLPAIDEGTGLLTYIDAIRKQKDDVIKFKATLDKLRALGMDDITYKKLLDEGVGAQAFLEELEATGVAGVAQLNTANAELAAAAKALGDQAAKDMFQAGVDVAQGIVDGLNKGLASVEKAMTKIAAAMVKAIKKELGIKSPSKEGALIGKFMNLGVAKGLRDYSGVVEKEAATVVNTAFTALKTSMAKLGDETRSNMDLSPVITPVIDLDQFRKDAAQIGALVNAGVADATASYGQAAAIFADRQAAQEVPETESESAGVILNFTQNNTSPKAISAADTYRQTNNQLSRAKEALKPHA
jgi:tape measure domain-containing protein